MMPVTNWRRKTSTKVIGSTAIGVASLMVLGMRATLATPSDIATPRGISGLEVGMTVDEIRQRYLVDEDQDPVAALLKKYGKQAEGEAVSRQNKAIQKQFFRVVASRSKLPNGVTSADARATHNIIYQIGLHYDGTDAATVSWEDVTYPYIVRYGKPEETVFGYTWKDIRTRLDIERSGSTINVFFTDQALEIEVSKAERRP